MSISTKLYMQFPWEGGLNDTLNESVIPGNQLTLADNIIIGERGSKKKRDGIKSDWDDVSSGSLSILGMHDFWYGATTRTQRLVSVASDGSIRSYVPSSGAATVITGGTSWSAPDRVSFEVLNNLLIIATAESGSSPKKWSGSGNAADLGGTPPQGSIVRQHLGRIWMNDKTNPDRIHYSTTGDPEEWNGTGDSGALDIGIGDGDPEGITAILPSFKGDLFVAKRTKLYRITGYTPEDFQVIPVSNGIGCVSHNSAFLIDETDVAFISERGVHSLTATQNFGDFGSTFLSYDIQKSFNDYWTKGRLKYSWGAYLSQINSVAFAVTDSRYTNSANQAVYLYNIPQKSWYRWPAVECQSMIVANDTDQKRFYFGGAHSKIAKSFANQTYDTTIASANFPINQFYKTGFIFPEGNPYKVYHFKKAGIIYKQEGIHTITLAVQIDNYPMQSLAFTNTTSPDLLGSTFVLGTSSVGLDAVLAPYAQPIDGVGRGIKFFFATSGTVDETEVWGFFFEYEDAETAQEVIE